VLLMELVLVRHGQSEGNARGVMQGRWDLPLTELGRAQAKRLAKWLGERAMTWDAHYVSPLVRARETAGAIAQTVGLEPVVLEDLSELHAGVLEGLDAEAIGRQHPDFWGRPLTQLGDFGEFGGESYETVQARAKRVIEHLETQHANATGKVLVVSHGGLLGQLLKNLVCVPPPRVMSVHFTNCSATLVRVRQRLDRRIGEVLWHLPLELMGA
jgi:broad specificity phosphatase PhoE